MSIERIKQDAAKADQLIAELARGALAPDEQDQGVAVEDQHQDVEQNNDEGVVAAATEDQGSPAELARPSDDAAKWEARYRSLDGMIQARDRQIEQLHQLLAAMQSAPSKKEEPAATPAKPLVGKEDEESFGADLIDLARRVAQEQSGAYITKLEQKITELESRLSGVAQTTAVSVQERFENAIANAAPDWKKIDSDPKFIEWLQSVPSRQRVFADAARAQDAEGVAYFYAEYAEKFGQAQQSNRSQLEKQVAPGRSRNVAPQARNTSEKKQWTRSEIAGFYAQGKKQYSSEEYAKLEKDLFAAQREGRVDYSR